MAEWINAFRSWWRCRRRFAGEWSFRQERGARGLTKRDVARRNGADLRGLLELLPYARTRRGPFFLPLTLAALTVIAIALDPLRTQLLASLLGSAHAQRFIPLTPAGIVPMAFAQIVLGIALLAGAAKMIRSPLPRRNWSVSLYGGVLLGELLLACAVVWIAGLQSLLSTQWGNDRIQGLALCYFAFGYVWLVYLAMRRWWRDVELRCPECLRLLGLHETHGKAHQLLIDPAEEESICLYGHGLALESRWRRSFDY